MGQQSENYDEYDIENGDSSTLVKAALRCRQDWDALETAAASSSSPSVSVNDNTSPLRQKQHVRRLTNVEIEALVRQGNAASPSDWSCVFVKFKEEESLIPPHCIRQCYFVGLVLLLADEMENGSTTVVLPDAPQFPHPSGLYNSTLCRCVVSLGSLVKDCSYICGANISSGAALVSCDTISGTPEGTTYGNGTPIKVGPETGERSIICHIRMSIQDIVSLVTDLASQEEKQVLSRRARDSSGLVRYNFTIVESGAVLLSCKRILDAYVGCGAIVRGADEVLNSTLLSNVEGPVEVGSGTRLNTVIMKEGSCVIEGATVSCSLLMEHASVTMHAKVSHSILCPDSCVSTGECHSSLVGPFIGFHHQALLISAIWPLGRGNISYGCNIGANHTTRRANQEIWPGEGMFFGLGCSMKFPSNFLESPYTIIAAGTTCLPQRLRMPFSLLSPPSCMNVPESAPQTAIFLGLCNLRPGWVLSNNIYMIVRNDMKYKTRSKARHCDMKWPVFRCYTVNLMISARKRLREAKPSFHLPDGSAIYIGDAAISGAGKNFVREEDCKQGIDTYTHYIRRFALRSMLEWLEEILGSGCFPGLPYTNVTDEEDHVSESDANSATSGLLQTFDSGKKSFATTSGNVVRGHHDQKLDWVKILLEDDELKRDTLMIPSESAIKKLFGKLLSIEFEMYQGALRSRSKDDIRGTAVIPNYSKIHLPATDDEVVLAILSEYEMTKSRIEAILSTMQNKQQGNLPGAGE